MPAFRTPVDIGNRGLQHCGAQQMDVTLGFAEQSKRAFEVSSCYDKLRQAELSRNVWTFATRRAPIRAIDTNTLLLAPSLWASTTTYFQGSVVSDQSGNLWESTQRNNLNNTPGNSPAWAPYFGPMTAGPFDSSLSYLAGEVVYTAAGNGTWNVWKSLLSGNTLHPALPNQWSTDTTYFQNNVVQQFPAWSSGTTYAQGQGALYTDGNVYVSLVNSNLDQIPPNTPSAWALMPIVTLATQQVPVPSYPAPVSGTTTPIDEWQQEASYAQGGFAIFNGSVYLSLQNNNTGQFPNAGGSWWVAVTGGTLYMSVTDLNIGNSPANAPADWSSVATYGIGATIAGSDGLIYTSLQNGNINHNPAGGVSPTFWTSSGIYTPWTTTFTLGGGNSQWVQIGGASFPMGVGLTVLDFIYPLGSGPSWQSGTRNVFRLPANYLREAPQDPKAGAISYLGAPGNAQVNDWVIENACLTSAQSGVIVLRFVADVQDVSTFDPRFCEGLACRVGMEVAETLTQSTAKLGTIAKFYETMMTDARTINAIEAGADEPPLDDYIACRY